MRLLLNLGRIFQAMGRMLGLGSRPSAAAVPALPVPALPVEVAVAVKTPAVAGFVQREGAHNPMLSRQIGAVAKLNVPAGRKPRTASKRDGGLPQVPAHRLGSKKQSLNGNRGPRVLRPTVAAVKTATNVIPFPVKHGATGQRGVRLTKAA